MEVIHVPGSAGTTRKTENSSHQTLHRQRLGRSGRRGLVRNLQPGHRRDDRPGRRRQPPRTSIGRSKPPAGRSSRAPGPRWTRPIVGMVLFKLADLVQEHCRELAALESLNCGKTISDVDRRHPRRRQHAALLRRLGRQDRRPHDSRPRQLPFLHAAAAGRRRRADHPLEFSADDDGLEDWARPSPAATRSCSSRPSKRR